jgi:SAM-dependent methyltransferase
MSGLAMARMFARELLARQRIGRGPTPGVALGAEGILAAMEDGGQVDGRTAAGYLYHSARISQVLAGRRRCVDIGCGTAMQLLQVAALNPGVQFTGIDPVPSMLARARERAAALGLANVDFERGDFASLLREGHGRFDAAISTMTLHHLPDTAALDEALHALAVAAGDAGAVYVEEFARLKTRASIEFFVGLNAPVVPDHFSALYRCSLGAAFTVDELRSAVARWLPGARLYSTFLVPFLNVVKTADGELSAVTRSRLAELLAALSPAARRDLDDLRRFFALGGLGNDPFEGVASLKRPSPGR